MVCGAIDDLYQKSASFSKLKFSIRLSTVPVVSLQADAQLVVQVTSLAVLVVLALVGAALVGAALVGPALVGSTSAALEVLVLFLSSLSFGYL